jgi:hypothetical protein
MPLHSSTFHGFAQLLQKKFSNVALFIYLATLFQLHRIYNVELEDYID